MKQAKKIIERYLYTEILKNKIGNELESKNKIHTCIKTIYLVPQQIYFQHFWKMHTLVI